MRFQCFVCLLLASLAHGQASLTTKPPADKSTEVEVGPNEPVISVNGLCLEPAPAGSACKTVVTRAQFEKLTEALQPGMSMSLRLNVANAYARNLRMSAAAEQRGLDKTPAFAEEMRYARMQLLSQDLNRVLQAEANNITDTDLEDYYQKNKSSFEQATIARIFVPGAKRIAAAHEDHQETGSADTRSGVMSKSDAQKRAAQERTDEEAKKKAASEAMAKVAADLRTLAVNGEDPDKLQMDAYTEAGLSSATPDTKMARVRRDTLPPQHETVMNLKPGDVSEVFSDPGGAYFIYKMISKETLTLEDVKSEIRTAISSQRYRDSMKAFQGDVVFSDAYFNPPGRLAPLPQRTRRRQKKNPPAHNDEGRE